MFGSLYKLFCCDLCLDLGTSNITVSQNGKVILSEATAIVVNTKQDNIVAIGETAQSMSGKLPKYARLIKPVKNGVIADLSAAKKMLKHLLLNIASKQRITVSISPTVTYLEKKATRDLLLSIGAKKVCFISKPMAAAIGAGITVAKTNWAMVVDIGASTTEAATIALNELIIVKKLNIGGENLNQNIINYVKKKFGVLIGNDAAEYIKINIGSAVVNSEQKITVTGKLLMNSSHKAITVTASEILPVVEEFLSKILELVMKTIEVSPVELAADLVANGITLAGGGAMLKGIDRFFKKKLECPIFVAKNANYCVINGSYTITKLQKKDKLDFNSTVA